MNPAALQFEKYWRDKIADQIIEYAELSHSIHSKFTTCLRCDITAVLRNVAREVRAG